MSHPRSADLEALLVALTGAGVEFIVVGGTAAVLHGAPITTQDLDIVHRQTPENVDRLVNVLEQLDAVFRPVLADRHIRPTREHLSGDGQLNLSTRLGPLDPLCRMDDHGYDELIERTIEVSDGSLTLRVLDLPALIEAKSRAGRPKDRLVLPVLLRLLDEQARDGADEGWGNGDESD